MKQPYSPKGLICIILMLTGSSFIFLQNIYSQALTQSIGPIITTSALDFQDTLSFENNSLQHTVMIYNSGDEALNYNITIFPAFTDNFEYNLDNWIYNGSWGITPFSIYGNALSDSPDGQYLNNVNQFIELKNHLTVVDPSSCNLFYDLFADMECCCDEFRTYLQVNNGSWILIDSKNCLYDDQLEYTLSDFVQTGDQIKFRFEFISDDSNTSDGVYIDNFYIGGVWDPQPWFSISPSLGTVAPGDSIGLDLLVNSDGIWTGDHYAGFMIVSNDPTNSYLFGGEYLTITAVPGAEIQISPENFNALLNTCSDSLTIPLQINNPGVAILDLQFSIPINPNIHVNENSLNILPGDSSLVLVTFYATDLPAGAHQTEITITSNDQWNPLITIPVTLNVNGLPSIEIKDTAFVFPTVPENSTNPDTLMIYNRSCGNLIISQISVTSQNFTVTPATSVIAGYDSLLVTVSYTPQNAGTHNDTLEVLTNDGNFNFPMSGSSIPAAVLNFTPDFYTINLIGCSDSVTYNLTLSNPGSDTLHYSIIQSIDFYEDFEDTLIGWTHQMFEEDSLWHVTEINSYSPGHSLWCGVELQGNYATGRRILNAIVTPPIDLRALTADDITTLHFMENYNTELFTDECKVHISIDGGVNWIWMNSLGNSGNSMGWVEANYDLTYYNGNIIMIRFLFNTYHGANNSFPGWFIDDVSITSTAGSGKWLEISDFSGDLNPGSVESLSFTFRNAGLTSGNYYTNVNFLSNATAYPVLSFPITLNTQGNGQLSIKDSAILMPEVMQNNITESTFYIFNIGCDTLSGAFQHNTFPFFTTYPYGNFFILPGDSIEAEVSFIASDLGAYSYNLILQSNIGELLIPVYGNSTPPPLLSYYPGQFNISTGSCSDSIHLPLTLYNNGTTDLDWQSGIFYYPEHRAIYFNGTHSMVQMPNWNPGEHWTLEAWVNPDTIFSGRKTIFGGVGSCSDWALTMEDGVFGLMIKPQSGNCQQTISSGITAVPGTWYHVAGVNNGDTAWIIVDGIAYNSAPVYTNYTGFGWWFIGREYLSFEHHYKGYIDEVRVWDYARNINEINHDRYHTLTGNENGLIGYWDMNQPTSGTLIDKSPMHRNGYSNTNTVSTNSPVDRFLLISPPNGVTQAGDSAVLTVTASSTYLNSGLTSAIILLNTNDPLHSFEMINFLIDVTGEPIIDISEEILHFPDVMQYKSVNDTLMIYNTGCDTLFLSGSYCMGSSFSVVPSTLTVLPKSENYLLLDFHPETIGEHSDTLYIPNNDSLIKVILTGTALPAPELAFEPDSLQFTIGCPLTGTIGLSITNNGSIPLVFSILPENTSWLYYTTETIELAPGGTYLVPCTFSRIGLNAGLYQSTIQLTSNDPRNTNVTIPVKFEVQYNYIPLDLGDDISVCDGAEVIIDAGTSFNSYLWSDGTTLSTLQAPSSASYSVTVHDGHACAYSDTVLVTFNPITFITMVADTILCSNQKHIISPGLSSTIQPTPYETQIGSGTTFTGLPGPSPFGTSFTDDRTQMLYTAEEMLSAGLTKGFITRLSFNIGAVGSPAMNDFNIKIGQTDLLVLTDFSNETSAIFHSNQYYPIGGWNHFTFSDPFYWDGVHNLIVEVCYDNASWYATSSVQYSTVIGKVWSQYCDNCGSGCNLLLGASSDKRANIKFYSQGDINQYTWTGPNGYFSHYKDVIFENTTYANAGMYHLSLENGSGCINKDSILIFVTQSPVIEISQPDTIGIGTSTQLYCTVNQGIPTYTYQWTPSSGLNDAAIPNPLANPIITTTYHIRVTGSNQCYTTDSTTITIIPVYGLQGTVSYQNSINTALQNIEIVLMKSNGEVIDTTLSDGDGSFEFEDQVAGTYLLNMNTDASWGGVNATDALLVGKHIVHYISLNGLFLKSADVNDNGNISSADPLLILKRTVGLLDSFPSGNWTFEKTPVIITNAAVILVKKGLCMGDVNGSFVPQQKSSSQTEVIIEGITSLNKEGIVDIPVSVNYPGGIGAFTLGFHLSEQVNHLISVTSDAEGMQANIINDNYLKVAWFDTEGLKSTRNTVLLTLSLKVSQSADLQYPLVVPDELCEIADPGGQIYSPLILYLPQIIDNSIDTALNVYVSPNPFHDYFMMQVFPPEAGFLTIEIYNSTGIITKSISQGIRSDKLVNLKINTDDLSSGIYFCKINLLANRHQYQQVVRVVKSY